MIGIGKALVLIPAFKPGMSRFLTMLDPFKETIIGPLDPQDDILEHMRGDVLILRSKLFDGYQITLLLIVANRLACHLPCFLALSERGVVEFPRTLYYPLQFVCRRLIRLDAKFVGFDAHADDFFSSKQKAELPLGWGMFGRLYIHTCPV